MILPESPALRRWLSQSNPFWFALYAGLSAFCLYTCVYAFRKTFAAATFDDIGFLGIDYKIWLVTSQVLGYAASKFAGIRIISELKASSRSTGILIALLIAGFSWFLFAVVPAPYNIIFLFTNGFPLGLVWGMVFLYLEGRRLTDVLGATLSVSFIFSSGLCKSIGGYLVRDGHISETWMPFVTVLIFAGPSFFFLWLLDHLPPPDIQDEATRSVRKPMSARDRAAFIRTFFLGLICLVLFYSILTAFRDFRDNFAADIWKSLGYGNSPEIFTTTEIPISLICLVLMGSLVFIKSNRLALEVIHGLILSGAILIGFATMAFQKHWIEGPLWMTLVGLGLYLGYIPFNCSFFDRLLGTFKITGTVGFMMYVSDSFGYLASTLVLFYKQFGQPALSWLEFFIGGSYVVSASGTVLVLVSLLYFRSNRSDSMQGTQRVAE